MQSEVVKEEKTWKSTSDANRVFLWAILVSLLSLLFSVNTAQAYEGTGENIAEKPNTWCQGCATNPSKFEPLVTGSNTTFGASGCGQFSYTALLIKSGARPVGYAPWDWNKELNSLGPDYLSAKAGWFNWKYSAEVTNNKLIYREDLSIGNPGNGLGPYPGTPTTDKIKELAKTYYMILLVPGHYIAVDYIGADGKVHIIDSAGVSATLEDMARDNSLQGIVVFESPNNPAGSAIHLDTMEGGATSTGTQQSGVELSTGLVSEDDLVGMPEKRNMYGDAQVPDYATGDDLTAEEKESIISAQTAIQQNKEATATNYLKVGVSLMGIILILWSAMLIVAWAFDRSNPFVRVSALKVMTFGRLSLADEPEDVDKSHIMLRGVLVRSAIGIALGALLVSGALYDIVYYIVIWAQSFGNK